ncbi:MAG: hypothetical protein U0Q03_04565 [Acidimicrobiales bacterium]
MLRFRQPRPLTGPTRSAVPTDPTTLGEALAEARPSAAGRPRRRRAGGRLLGFGAAVVLLGQCGNSCTPNTSGGAGTNPSPAAAAAPAATTPPGVGGGNTGNGQPNMDADGVFRVIAPGGQLPSDEACAAAVRANPSPENRPRNVSYNNTAWHSIPGFYERATGNFTGSTDDIIRWTACKWGYDEYVLRAQAARESTGKMDALGVWVSNSAQCLPGHPIGADGRPGQCPGAIGIIQIFGYYFPQAIEGSTRSTAYNLDIGIAIWRDCYEGGESWLGNGYHAGDLWGCVGRFYSGAWYDSGANWYINELQTWAAQKYWETSRYINDQGPSV